MWMRMRSNQQHLSNSWSYVLSNIWCDAIRNLNKKIPGTPILEKYFQLDKPKNVTRYTKLIN